MVRHLEMAAKVQQFHDVLQMLLIAIAELPVNDDHPVYGVVRMLIDQFAGVAEQLHEYVHADGVRHGQCAIGSKEDV
ncbi:hypothetical protein [Caballeronia sp. HLA56]